MQRQGISLLEKGDIPCFFVPAWARNILAHAKTEAREQGAGQASGSEKTSKKADDKKWKYGQRCIREFFQS